MGMRYTNLENNEQRKLLQDSYSEALNILRKCDIDIHQVCHYHLRVHSKIACGVCNYSEEIISIGIKYLKWAMKYNREDEVINTMIHEMLHIVAKEKYNCKGHTGKWKELAKIVSSKTEYNIERLLNQKDSKVYNEEIGRKRKTLKPKYTVVCSCGANFNYTKKSKNVKLIECGMGSLLKCPKCGGNYFTLSTNYYF